MYLTPRNWRWWFTIGINPQAIHDVRHYRRPVSLVEVFDRIGKIITATLVPALTEVAVAFNQLGRQLEVALAPLIGSVPPRRGLWVGLVAP